MWIYVTYILTIAIAIIGILRTKDRSKIKILLIIIFLLLFIAQVLAYRDQVKQNQTLKNAGTLRGATVTLLSASQNIYPRLKLGNSAAFFTFDSPGKSSFSDFFQFAKDLTLKIWAENGQMKLSTKIRDKNGNLIAEIIANEWVIKPEAAWDRNYTSNALEVKNPMGEIVLQVIMHEGYIQLAAKMYDSNGDGFAIGSKVFTKEDGIEHEQGKQIIIAAANSSKGEVSVGEITGVFELRPKSQGLPLKLTIDPIFQYPSNLHLGELLNQ